MARLALGIDPAPIKYHSFINSEFEGTGYILSKTGYTGEKGFEIYIHKHTVGRMWDALMDAGNEFGLLPCGLGSRDTLRLEMGYLLYGNDIGEETTPIEASAEWTVNFQKGDFIGHRALQAQVASSHSSHIRLLSQSQCAPGIIRHCGRQLESHQLRQIPLNTVAWRLVRLSLP